MDLTTRDQLLDKLNKTTRDDRLVLAFVGPASSGKDSAIRALFGIDFGEIDPIPGSTSEVRVIGAPHQPSLLILNAPGFGDHRSEVEERSRQIINQIDLAIFVMNCEGGATRDEYNDLQSVRQRAKGLCPTLVCLNKLDLIPIDQREHFIAETVRQLDADPDDVVACAFDPLPQLSPEPVGLEDVHRWILKNLEDHGKELVYARSMRDRHDAALLMIERAAVKAAAAGAVPVPGVDLGMLTLVQARLVQDLAHLYGRSVSSDTVLWLVGELLGGSTKGFVRWGVQAMKTAGWIPGAAAAHMLTSGIGAAIAYGCTTGIGHAAMHHFDTDGSAPTSKLKDIFDSIAMARTKEQLGLDP